MRIKFIPIIFLLLFTQSCKDHEPTISELLVGTWEYKFPAPYYLRTSASESTGPHFPTTILTLYSSGSFEESFFNAPGNIISKGTWYYDPIDNMLSFMEETKDCSSFDDPEFECNINNSSFELISIDNEKFSIDANKTGLSLYDVTYFRIEQSSYISLY